eukprot:TRINITY_DN935_c0_g1_i1.p1 TRINITY_DN935_c0_g1~~TRINITY_DN935_c0_g1_i1.p1  ORF type:complete len:312 (-),score=73.78 TRINITY_DN935_c0_g1_i1:20-955(-)
MKQANIDFKELKAVAVTQGPGMAGALKIGMDRAISICKKHDLPLICVNHLEGHVLMPRMFPENSPGDFPFMVVLVSGGHSQILVCKGIGEYLQLAGTLDDSLGEAFDKVGRLLGNKEKLHGGPFIENLALKGNPDSHKFPIPMKQRGDTFDMSFSGLKSFVAKFVENSLISKGNLDEISRANIAASFQKIAVGHVVSRTSKSVDWCSWNLPEPIKTAVICGGAAKNALLRQEMTEVLKEKGISVKFPPLSLCTDNGVMIAWAAVEQILANKAKFLRNFDELEVKARFPLCDSFDLFKSNYNESVLRKRRGL